MASTAAANTRKKNKAEGGDHQLTGERERGREQGAVGDGGERDVGGRRRSKAEMNLAGVGVAFGDGNIKCRGWNFRPACPGP